MNKEVSCIICNKVIPVDQMRADKSARGWICPGCYDKQNYKKSLKSIYKDYRTLGLTQKGIEKKSEEQKKQNYRCALCKFVSKQTSANAPCPNCGKKDVLIRIQSTSEILKELELSPF